MEYDSDLQVAGQVLSHARDMMGMPDPAHGGGAGLSTLELRRRFPEARSLTGVDLSPHFLAVARVTQRRRGAPRLVVPGEGFRFRYRYRFPEARALTGMDLSLHCLAVAARHAAPPRCAAFDPRVRV